jgi:predicted metal-dependent hydrolase
MSTDKRRIVVAGISVEVDRKPIKHLHLGVYPPQGRVRAAAPAHMTDDAVRLAVVTRIGWIRRQRNRFAAQERQSRRQLVTGESHFFEGRRYRLVVTEGTGRAAIRLRNSRTIEMRVPPGTGVDARHVLLYGWYRDHLRNRVPDLIAKWEPAAGVRVSEWRLKKMRTRWGTCNAEAGRIWLNVELAKKPPSCLEFILVHEMVHLIERNHTEAFQRMMDELMPGWRVRRDMLNRAPLAHETWAY